MQQLAAQSVNDADAIINRMMGYVPDLHKIWVGASDVQLMALSKEFPEFYRYALIMEDASEAERNKPSRPYDDMAQFPEQHKQMAAQLLATAATLERGYLAFVGSGKLEVFQPQVNDMNKQRRQWLSELENFKSTLRAQGIDPKGLEYMNEVFGRLAERIKKLAALS